MAIQDDGDGLTLCEHCLQIVVVGISLQFNRYVQRFVKQSIFP
jgi:hypothetical protein